MKLSTRIMKSIQDLKRLAGIAATIAVAVATVSCGSSKDEPEGPTNEHTVIVYMAACNSLGSGGYDRQDLIEMQEAVANNTLHGQVLVYRGDIDGNAKLYRMTAEGPKPLRDYASDGLSSVHSERMINVLKDARTLAPARSYGLVLWSHGNGWLQTGIEDNNHEFQPTAWGEDRGRVMNITTLRRVLEQVGTWAYIYFDCCFMASVEVVYELRNTAPYIIGSATELLLTGMPYEKNIPCLFEYADGGLVRAATNTFNYYNDMTTPKDRTCTISVVSTAALDDVAAACRDILVTGKGKLPDGFRQQPFMVGSRCWFYDLGHYYDGLCQYIAEDVARPEGQGTQLKAALDAALNRAVIYAAATPRLWNRISLEYHCGLSTYPPENAAAASVKNYNTLTWYSDVSQHTFSTKD